MSKPEKYLAFFQRAYTDTANDGVQRYPGLALSWNWPAFLFTFSWLFYRKQYLLGFLFFGINAAVFTLVGDSLPQEVVALVLKFVIALNARPICVAKAVKKIREARARQIPVREWEAHLQLIGGVSHFAALVSFLVWAGAWIGFYMILYS